MQGDDFMSWKECNGKFQLKNLKHVCYTCYVPSLGGLHQKELGSACQFKDTILPVAYAVWRDEDAIEAARAYFSRHWPTDMDFVAWLTLPVVGEPACNLHRLFTWFCDTYLL
jgi:hypothetical protein